MSVDKNMIIMIIIIFFMLVAVAFYPKGSAKTGLYSGKLRPCPSTSNCVVSTGQPEMSYIEPLLFDGEVGRAWQNVKKAIISSGGKIQKEENGYLWAIYTSRWLRFVDDVELSLDITHKIIHVRSASRVGHSDFGVNRNRVERLRLLFNEHRLNDN